MRAVRLGAVSVLVSAVAITGWAWAGIEGSKHDFSNKEWSGGDACGACHSLESDQPPTAAPLWDQDADLNRTFGASLIESKAAGQGTVLCLRCHDGTIARDTIAETPQGPRFVNQDHAGIFATGHGTSNHPVGVRYPPFREGYRPPASVIASRTVTLPDGNVECISCHDPHNTSGEKHMLVMRNTRSALCLTCHKK